MRAGMDQDFPAEDSKTPGISHDQKTKALSLLSDGRLWTAYQVLWEGGVAETDPVGRNLSRELVRLQKLGRRVLERSLKENEHRGYASKANLHLSPIIDPGYDSCLKALRPNSKLLCVPWEALGVRGGGSQGPSDKASQGAQPLFGFHFDSIENVDYVNYFEIPGIQSLIFQRCRPNLKSLQDLKHLHYLEFSQISSDPAAFYGRRDFEALTSLEPLEILCLGENSFRLDDWSLELLPHLNRLHYLSLTKTLYEDTDLSPLGECPRLENLFLDEFVLGPRVFDSLALVPQLKRLRIACDDFQEAAFARYVFGSPLRELMVPRSQLSDVSLSALAYAQDLRKIDIGSPFFTEIGFELLARNKNLRSVRLQGPVTNSVMKVFAQNDQLEHLSVLGGQLDDLCISDLFAMESLKTLRIGQNNFSKAGLSKLRVGLAPQITLKVAQNGVLSDQSRRAVESRK
jgi:hypothetical protein